MSTFKSRSFDDPLLLDNALEPLDLARRLEPICPDLALRQMYGVFKQAVLVPWHPGQPTPKPDYAETSSGLYQAQLMANDVAVLCDPQSGNLCALVIPKPEVYGAFLKDNPALKRTLVILGHGGAAVFMRITGDCPSSQSTALAHWLSSGEAFPIHQRGEAESAFKCLRPAWPVEVPFSSINWKSLPELALKFRLLDLEKQHGGPILTTRKGHQGLNPSYWAAFCVSELGLRYNTTARRFERLAPGTTDAVAVSEESIMTDISRLLLVHSRMPGNQALEHQREPLHLRRVVATLKILGAVTPADEHGAMVKFLYRSVELCPGADVTSEELYGAYKIHCSVNQLPAGSEYWFHRESTAWLRVHFQVTKNHATIRSGTARRGFQGLRLSLSENTPETVSRQMDGVDA